MKVMEGVWARDFEQKPRWNSFGVTLVLVSGLKNAELLERTARQVEISTCRVVTST
jgi:hypothetical protein